ncbi:hypothetical protein BC834DRAFT_852844 [Gloeopeniophorella convolvens]|nr:hypothetical protein BC834DRAFT_852844 [Gloeopeniophorella convolvens]
MADLQCSVEKENDLRPIHPKSSVGLFTPLILECTLFGIYTPLIILSTYILCRRSMKKLQNILILFATLVMYAMATTHWVQNIRVLRMIFWEGLPSQNVFFTFQMADDDEGHVPIFLSRGVGVHVNFLLSSIFTMWRAWLLCGKPRAVFLVFLCLGIALFVVGSVSMVTDKGAIRQGPLGDQYLTSAHLDTNLGIITIAISLVCSVLSAALIASRIWIHRRFIAVHFESCSRRWKAEQCLAIIVESGVIYAIILLALLLFNAITASEEQISLLSENIVQITGIYWTKVAIIVSMRQPVQKSAPKSTPPTILAFSNAAKEGSQGSVLPTDLSSAVGVRDPKHTSSDSIWGARGVLVTKEVEITNDV